MLRKRLTVAAFDAAFACTMVACAWGALCTPAAAYVDPSVMTYTIQALAGVAVALSAVIGVAWRRIRRWLFKVLKIDENAGKVVEPNVTVATAGATAHMQREATREKGAHLAENIAANENLTSDALTLADAQAKEERSRQGMPYSAPLSWVKRFLIALVAMALIMYVNVVATPYQIVGGNQDSLMFSVLDVGVTLFVFAIVAGVLCALALSALKGKAFDITIAVLYALGVASFVQSLFLNSGLPSADGHEVIWSEFLSINIISAVVWIALIAGAIVLFIKKPLYARLGLVFLAFVIMAVESFGVVRYTRRAMKDGTPIVVTKEGLFEVSSKSNVIVFVIDTVDTQEFDTVLTDYPDVLDGFDGFTYFHNSVGSMIPTAYGVPFLITGEEMHNDETLENYLCRRWESNFISDIYNNNYTVSLYADNLYNAKTEYGDMTVNLHTTTNQGSDFWGTVGVLTKVSLYSNAPWALKPLFWYYTDDMNQGVINYKNSSDDSKTPYVIDDVNYYNELTERGLSVAEDDSADGALKLIHLNAAHVPFEYDENVEEPAEGSTMEKQTRGTFTILKEYIDELKELGVYDSSTIIITADHGYWGATLHGADPEGDESTAGSLSHVISPICLVKPAGATGSYTTSEAPVSHIDFQSTVLEAMGVDGSAYGEGTTYFDIAEDASRTRRFINNRYTTELTEMDEYLINGNALDFDNWTYTGKTWSEEDL